MEFNFKLPTYSLIPSIWGNSMAHFKAMNYENTRAGKVAHFLIGLATLIPGLGLIEWAVVKALGETHNVQAGLTAKEMKQYESNWLKFFVQNEQGFENIVRSKIPPAEGNIGADQQVKLPGLLPRNKDIAKLLLNHRNDIRSLDESVIEGLPLNVRAAFIMIREPKKYEFLNGLQSLFFSRIKKVFESPTKENIQKLTEEDKTWIADLVEEAASPGFDGPYISEIIRKLGQPKNIQERREGLEFFSKLGPIKVRELAGKNIFSPSETITLEAASEQVAMDVKRSEILIVDGIQLDFTSVNSQGLRDGELLDRFKELLVPVQQHLQQCLPGKRDEEIAAILDLCHQGGIMHQMEYFVKKMGLVQPFELESIATGNKGDGLKQDAGNFIGTPHNLHFELNTSGNPVLIATSFYPSMYQGFFIKAVSTFDLAKKTTEMVYEVIKLPEEIKDEESEKAWAAQQLSKGVVVKPGEMPKFAQ